MKYSIAPAVFLSCLLSSIALQAGAEKGNGGHGILCAKNGKKSVMQYDYYEGMNKYHLVYDQGPPALSVAEKVRLVLDRLKRINPTRARLYEGWYATFESDAEFARGRELILIPDSGDGEIPAGCELKQLAVQREPKFPGEKRYTINADLWDLMDNDNKASLILHELIYREAAGPTARHDNSKNARYFHEVISTRAIETMTVKQYVELLRLVDFPSADTPRVLVCLYYFEAGNGKAGKKIECDQEFDERGNLVRNYLIPQTVLSYHGLNLEVQSVGRYRSTFHADGTPEFLYFREAALAAPLEASFFPYESLRLERGVRLKRHIAFDARGSLAGLKVDEDRELSRIGFMRTAEAECEFTATVLDSKDVGDGIKDDDLFRCDGKGKLRLPGMGELGFDSAILQISEKGLSSVMDLTPAARIALPSGKSVVAKGLALFEGPPQALRGVFELSEPVSLVVQGMSIQFRDYVEFHRSGKPSGGRLVESTVLKTLGGRKRFKAGQEVRLDEEGLATGK